MAGKIGGPPTVQFVCRADFQFRHPAQHVEQHQSQRVRAAQPGGVARGHRVEPAATPRSFSDGAVFVAFSAYFLARGVVLLGGERSAADPGVVRFDNPDHLVDVSPRHSRAGRRAHARAVAAGDEGERAVVDVQQRALRALEQHAAVGLDRVEQEGRRVGHVWRQPLGVGVILVEYLLGVEPDVGRKGGEHFVLRAYDPLDPPTEVGPIHVAGAHGQRAADLVAVARTDAAQRGADRFVAALPVQQAVLLEVPGEDHVCPIADDQVVGHLHAEFCERVDFFEQRGGVQHHAGGDDAPHFGAENAAGYQREFIGPAVADDGVSGIGPTLVADHDFVSLGQQVDDFPLRLVAPLQTNHASNRHRKALDGLLAEISKRTNLSRVSGRGQVPLECRPVMVAAL